jgi:hypothetical protein
MKQEHLKDIDVDNHNDIPLKRIVALSKPTPRAKGGLTSGCDIPSIFRVLYVVAAGTSAHTPIAGLPSTVYRLPSTVYRLPSTVYRLSYRLPSTVYRLPSTAYRLLPIAYRLSPTAYRLPPTVYPPSTKFYDRHLTMRTPLPCAMCTSTETQVCS